MRRYLLRIAALCCLILIISLSWLYFHRNKAEANRGRDLTGAKANATQVFLNSEPPRPASAGRSGAAGASAAPSASVQPAASSSVILEEINDAAVMYDPAYLPAIQKYLLNSNPEIRKAALNGMIVLGHPAASPMLRAAAKLVDAPQETVAMLQAADYLELPSGTMIESGKIRRGK